MAPSVASRRERGSRCAILVSVASHDQSACPGCGLVLPAPDEGGGATHPYIGATPACWALYGELLAREYGELAYQSVHRLTVDAYAAQHPGRSERRSRQSVAVHLMRLCLALERGATPDFSKRLMRSLTGDDYPWLEPPRPIGSITVRDVLVARGADEHAHRVKEWAADVWRAWSPHHTTVAGWLDRHLGSAGDRPRPPAE